MKTTSLLAILLLANMASADLVSYFNNQFIPIEKIEVRGDTVTAYYNMDLMMGPTEYKQDLAYVFGTLTKEYPNAKEIKIICYAGGKPTFDYTAKSADIAAYANDELSESEFVSRIDMGEHKDAGLDGGMLLLIGAGGLILLAFAALTVVVVITTIIIIKKKKKQK